MDLIQDLEKKVSNIERNQQNRWKKKTPHQSKWQTYSEVQRNRRKTEKRGQKLWASGEWTWRLASPGSPGGDYYPDSLGMPVVPQSLLSSRECGETLFCLWCDCRTLRRWSVLSLSRSECHIWALCSERQPVLDDKALFPQETKTNPQSGVPMKVSNMDEKLIRRVEHTKIL